MGVPSRIYPTLIVANKPASAGHVAAELDNLIYHVADNAGAIATHESRLDVAEATLADYSAGVDGIGLKDASFTLATGDDIVLVARGAADITATLPDPSTFTEGFRRLIVADSANAVVISSSYMLSEPGDVILGIGDAATVRVVEDSGASNKWSVEVVRSGGGRGLAVIEDSTSGSNSLTRTSRIGIAEGSGAPQFVLPAIGEGDAGLDYIVINSSSSDSVSIQVTGNDRIMAQSGEVSSLTIEAPATAGSGARAVVLVATSQASSAGGMLYHATSIQSAKRVRDIVGNDSGDSSILNSTTGTVTVQVDGVSKTVLAGTTAKAKDIDISALSTGMHYVTITHATVARKFWFYKKPEHRYLSLWWDILTEAVSGDYYIANMTVMIHDEAESL